MWIAECEGLVDLLDATAVFMFVSYPLVFVLRDQAQRTAVAVSSSANPQHEKVRIAIAGYQQTHL